jgi:hypothetical protein
MDPYATADKLGTEELGCGTRQAAFQSGERVGESPGAQGTVTTQA